MVAREDVIGTARTFLGTPFRHQGRQPGKGLDCVGIIVCVARKLAIADYDVTAYSRLPQGQTILWHLERAGLVRIAPGKARPGDVLVMRFEKDPQHLALLTDRGILHADLARGAVVEHRLDETWAGRIVAAFQFPGMDEV